MAIPANKPHALKPFEAEWPALVIPVLAGLLVLPLLRGGPSCGHDFGFHMQSWMDAAAQLRQRALLPSWAFSPAFNAGEPRFIFYPPLSWLLGALLLSVLPNSLVPAVFTFAALLLAGTGMYALARRFATGPASLLACALYMANPYLLFTAFERTAFAELLAAAWLPWLVRAALAEQPRVLAVALPVALVWLTNAPAAVMGTYALALVFGLRAVLRRRAGRGELGLPGTPAVWPLVRSAAAGLLLGLALAAFYLVPAAWERRYVQIAMAIIPNMRVEDNFLFGHTGYGPHDQVLHTASLVAVSLLMLTAVALLACWGLRSRFRSRQSSLPALTVLAVAIALLLLHVTLPLWHLLPELAFLQFPWRWLAVLGCVFGAAAAMALGTLRLPAFAAVVASLVVAFCVSPVAMAGFRQGCELDELPADRVALFASHHGVGPTDEYTPGDADNDQLRWDDPAWWLTTEPNAPAPGTVPNPAATIVDYDQPPPLDQTVSGRAPTHLHVHLATPKDLVLNLRDYPAWQVTVNGVFAPHIERDDGLLTVALPAGDAEIAVQWRRLCDVWLGDGLSCGAAVVALGIGWRSRRITPKA